MLWFKKKPGIYAFTQNVATHHGCVREYCIFVRQKIESEARNMVLTTLRTTGIVTLIEDDKVSGFFR
jgi:hypothetical protein